MAGFQDWLGVTDPKLLAETMAEQFRLSQNELEKAQAALQPAFALGLQKAMANPAAWNDMARAFTAMVPGGGGLPRAERGNAFLDTVFGSDALTEAIARQASLFAGIAPDVMQKLMPGLAMLSMDAMLRQTMANLARHQPAGLATGDFGGATAEMMRRGANAVEALSRPSDARGPPSATPSFVDAFSDAMKQGFAWMPGAAPPPPAAADARSAKEAAPFNPMLPFATVFEAFSKGMQGALEAKDEAPLPTPEPPVESRAKRAEPVDNREDPVGDLLRTGQKLQEDYAREMAGLFERYQTPGKAP